MKGKLAQKAKVCSILILLAVLASQSLYAYTPVSIQNKFSNENGKWDRKYWEIGVTADAGASNNFFSVGDIFQEEIVIDLRKMAQKLNYRGFIVDANADARAFTNVYVKNFSVGLDVGAEALVAVNLKKDLIDFLATGNVLNKDYKLGIGAGASAFAEVKVPVGFKLQESKLRLSVAPSLFVPLAYSPYVNGYANVRLNSNGSFEITANQVLSLYSAIPFMNIEQTTFADIMQQCGFDISLAGEYELFPYLDVGASVTHVPIVPSHLSCRYRIDADLAFTTNGDGFISDIYKKKSIDEKNYRYSFTEVDTGSVESIKVLRPMKLGFWVNWRPLNNNLLIVKPFIQFRFLDTTVSNDAGFGFDYAATVMSDLKWGIFNFTTAYLDKKFKHELGFAFNLRFFELDLAVSVQSASFLQSFCGDGFGAKATVIFGL